MARMSDSEFRSRYSWWWDSHICPKNSKWLLENLADMDSKIKAMVAIIEEDADSFAKRADMYYRRRPELMSLVEQFYRAYRALAERYDYATGTLRQAHKKMAEAFPDQDLFEFDDDMLMESGAMLDMLPVFDSADGAAESSRYEVLQQQISRLSQENEELRRQMKLHPESEMATLKESLSIAESEKEAALLQCDLSHTRLTNLSAEISRKQEELGKLRDEMQTGLKRLESAEERCRGLETTNHSLQMELDRLRFAIHEQGEELNEKHMESQKLSMSIKENRIKNMINSDKLQKELSKLSQQRHDLKNQIAMLTMRCEGADSEVARLKEALLKSESERSAVMLQCQKSSTRLANLRTEIANTQREFRKLKEEMQSGNERLSDSTDQCAVLEGENSSLKAEVDRLTKRVKDLQEDLEEKQAELEKLGICIHEEQLKSMQAEMARLSLEHQLAELTEKLETLVLEKQEKIDKYIDMERSRFVLESELENLHRETKALREEKSCSASKLSQLFDEMVSLKQVQVQLENDASVHVEEKGALRDELSRLRVEKDELARQHHSFVEQMGSVNLNVEMFHELVQEMRDSNVELREIIRNYQSLNVLDTESKKQFERMSEKNTALELSLSAAHDELGRLRKAKKDLEDSCGNLNSEIFTRRSEKVLLVSQIDTISKNMEKLSARNKFLENSLSDATVELETLRVKVRDMEESSRSLSQQNTAIGSEKNMLVSQFESVSYTLVRLETRYAELERRHSDLQLEKDIVLDQLVELQLLLEQERGQHMDQLSKLEKQIGALQEEGRLREEKLELEECEILNAQIEIFVLRRCLCDVTSTSSTGARPDELKVLTDPPLQCRQDDKKLARWIQLLVGVLKLNRKYDSVDKMNDEVMLQLILHEIRCMSSAVSDICDGRQNQLLEKSLAVTLIEHFGHELAELRSERNILKQESQHQIEELFLRRNEHHADKYAGRPALNGYDDDDDDVVAEVLNLEVLNSIFRHLLDDQMLDSLSLKMEAACLHAEKLALENEISAGKQMLQGLEVENNHLKNDLSATRAVCDLLMSEIDAGKNVLMQKDTELSQSKRKLQQQREMNVELCRDIDEAKAMREKMGNDLVILFENSKNKESETAFLHRENEALREELRRVKRSGYAPAEAGPDAVKLCDAEIAKLLHNIQAAVANTALFKEKVVELVQMLEGLEASGAANEDASKTKALAHELKEKLDAIDVENRRLKVDVNGDFKLLTTSVSRQANNKPRQEDLPMVPPACHDRKQMELTKLNSTVRALQKAVSDAGALLEREKTELNPSFSDSRKHIEIPKLKEVLHDNSDAVAACYAHKDIPLDLPQGSRSSRRKEKRSVSRTDGMFEVLQSNIVLVEAVPEMMERKRPSTDLMSEKELGIDEQVLLPKKGFTESYHEWRTAVVDGLSSDARRLTALLSALQELKNNIQLSEALDLSPSHRLGSIKTHVKEFDVTVSQLLDANAKLSAKVEDLTASQGETWDASAASRSQRKISERAQKLSGKIGRLELEIQKTQHVFAKLEEDHANRGAKMTPRVRPRVRLVEYFYGRRLDSRRPKRNNNAGRCGCMRAKTSDEQDMDI